MNKELDETTVLTEAVKKWGSVAQIEMLNEEATELALAARKLFRDDSNKRFEQFADEIADVQIMINQMFIVFPTLVEEVEKRRQFKIKRLKRRIDGDNFEGE